MSDDHRKISQARRAAHASWARTPDRTARTRNARAGLEAKFAAEVDAAGVRPQDREKALENLRKAYYSALALRRWHGNAA